MFSGGGVYLKFGQGSTMSRNIISGNETQFGAGVYIDHHAGTQVTNCTIAENTAESWAGGIYTASFSYPQVENCILYGNSAEEHTSIFVSGDDSLTINYSDIEGGWEGTGNISADPLFVNPSGGNYNLSWINYPAQDSTKSPCIDSGNPSAALFDPDSTRCDMGALYFPQSIAIHDLRIEIESEDIILMWDSVEGAVFYRAYAADNPYGLNFIMIGEVSAPDTVFTDVGAAAAGAKFYRVTYFRE